MTAGMKPIAHQVGTAKAAESSALVTLLLVVTLTTGVMDAVSVLGLGLTWRGGGGGEGGGLGRGFVSTANMTGNVVFLGFALAGAPGYAPWVYVAALTAFLVGAVIGGRLGRRFHARRSRWLLGVAL